MKPILFFCFSLVLPNILPAQTLLQDAMELRQYFDTTDVKDPDKRLIFMGGAVSPKKSSFFRKYISPNDTLSTATLQKTFKDNPFLRMEVTDQNILSFDMPLRGVDSGASPGGSSGIGSGSGFSVAGFADGLARFLVKRTKQELSQAFFDDFKVKVETDPYLKHFCPATKQHLLMVDQDVYQFKDYLEGLRESFILDMTALPGNTEGFLRDDVLCPDCSTKADGKVMIDFLHLAQQMTDGEPPIDMIDYLAGASSGIQSAKLSEPALYDMAGGLRFLDLVSASLRNPNSNDPKMPWYTGRELREMFQDPKLFRLYLGLLWQRADKIAFLDKAGTKAQTMRSILGAAGTSLDLFKAWRNSLESLGETTHALQRAVSASSSINLEDTGMRSNTFSASDFFRYSQSLCDLMKTLNQTGRQVLQRSDNLIPETYISLMQQSNSLYFNVRQRNYTGAISNVIFCLNVIGKDKKEIASLLKYANFVASIAEANSPEEIEHAIELFALPPGSSRMKKQPGRFAVALNAYSGLAGGAERLDGDDFTKSFGAVTAPVGLSLSWGLGHKKKNEAGGTKNVNLGSLGFFIPLLDVGAVTAFRFKDNTSQNLPDLTWGNILSPGLYLVYDFKGKWPISLGLGGQSGPGLRKVTVANDVVIEKSGVRYGAFLTVDIPITYFHLGKGKE